MVSTANGFELLSFDLSGTQISSESLSGTELNNAEIWSRIDLDGDGTDGAQINTLLASGRINDPNPGSGHYRDGTRRFAYDTSQGFFSQHGPFNTTSNGPMMEGSTLDLHQAGDYHENRYEGPQILLSNGNNAAYSIPAGETLLAARERIVATTTQVRAIPMALSSFSITPTQAPFPLFPLTSAVN